jgi:hypothetical protein
LRRKFLRLCQAPIHPLSVADRVDSLKGLHQPGQGGLHGAAALPLLVALAPQLVDCLLRGGQVGL